VYTIVCASKNDMSLHLLYDSFNPKFVFFYTILSVVVVYNHDLIKVIVVAVVVDFVNFMCDIMKSCVLCIQK